MLFRLAPSKLFEENPYLKINPKFSDCTERELRWIFLVYDYESPLRKMSIAERSVKAALDSGYHMEKSGRRLDKNARLVLAGKVPRVQEAIGEFKLMQFDEDYEMYLALQEQLRGIREFFLKKDKTATELEKSTTIIGKLPLILKYRREVASLLDLQNESVEKADDDDIIELSTLDEVNMEEQNNT